MAGTGNDDAHRNPRHSNNHENDSRKRKHRASSFDNNHSMGQALSHLQQPDLPEFNITSARGLSQDSGSASDRNESKLQDWQTVEHGRMRKKAKKIPKSSSNNYPAIEFSNNSRLQSQIKISDLQNLVLYILADGPSPQFVSVRNRPEIRKVVVLMVPGLERSMFDAKTPGDDLGRQNPRDLKHHNYASPDEYYPIKLKSDNLESSVHTFADIFQHLWPVKTPGDDKFAKMHSPLHAMLTAPLSKKQEEKNRGKNGKGPPPAKEPRGWKNTRTPVTEFIHTPEDLLENDYVLHPASYKEEVERVALAKYRRSKGVSKDDGWVDTQVKQLDDGSSPESEIEAGSITAGREPLAMDCEMCMTGENEFSLTRISIVGWDGSVIMDELVKPEKPIINYLTQYSGITEPMLADVATTLADIQKKLIDILHPRTILIGHSLNSDLTALKITHPFIIDTAIIYPHPRGPPLKSSLKWLAKRYLNREIQKGHGTTGPGAGHDSIEDSRTCLDLLKQKCEKGKEWGTSDSTGENIFKRVAREGVRYKNQGGSAIPSPLDGKSSAAIDWGDPKKGPGAAASFAIGCKSDEEVMESVIRAVKGDADGKEIPGGGVDFVWARLRELEALKGWWNNNKLENAGAEYTTATEKPTPVVDNIAEIKDNTSSDPVVEKDGSSTETKDICTTHPDSQQIIATGSALPPPVTLDPSTPISTATADLSRRIAQIYESLPPCTALLIYSGSGDPREMSRLQGMHTQFKKEYKIKKWDELSIKWTDTEEQALRRAVKVARDGVGFVTVK